MVVGIGWVVQSTRIVRTCDFPRVPRVLACLSLCGPSLAIFAGQFLGILQLRPPRASCPYHAPLLCVLTVTPARAPLQEAARDPPGDRGGACHGGSYRGGLDGADGGCAADDR
eukprot:2433438-Pyramimonas_sp.AAC.1